MLQSGKKRFFIFHMYMYKKKLRISAKKTRKDCVLYENLRENILRTKKNNLSFLFTIMYNRFCIRGNPIR